MAWIQIFKAGKHTSSNGVTAEYGLDFCQAVVDNYNANTGTHLAPLTLGHKPKSGDPAYGWAKQLRLTDGVIEAELADVDPEFSTAKYKKVSASFFLPDSPSNPTPGSPNLRHIAALGAETAGCTGLKNIEFSDDMTGIVEFADGLRTQAGLFRSIREWILSKFSAEDADKAVPASEIEWLNTLDTIDQIDEAVKQATEGADAPEATDMPQTAPAFSAENGAVADDQTADASFTSDEQGTADFAAREAAITAREAELAAKEAALREAECAQFCEGLVFEGRLPPACKDNAKNLLASLYLTTGSVDFSETTVSPADAFKQLLSSLPKTIDFGEAAPEDEAPVAATTADFVAAPGYSVNQAQLREYARLVQLAQERGITLADAVAQKL